MRPLREVEGPFEHGDGLGEVSLAQRPKAHGPIGQDTAKGVIGGLGHPHPFLGGRPPLGEGAALGKGEDEETAGEHGRRRVQAEALLEQRAVETHHILAEILHRARIVPQAAVGQPHSSPAP